MKFKIKYVSATLFKYDEARTDKAEPLPIRDVIREQTTCSKGNGCWHRDVLVIDVPEARLRGSGASGFPIKLFSTLGPPIKIDIPKSLIVALFAAVDSGEKNQVALAAPKAAQ